MLEICYDTFIFLVRQWASSVAEDWRMAYAVPLPAVAGWWGQDNLLNVHLCD